MMEKTPYQPHVDRRVPPPASATVRATAAWQLGLPPLTGTLVTVRELRISDAPSLLAAMSTEDVARFISPPPTTVEGFEKFIAWTHRQRAAGQYVCFTVVLRGSDSAIGLFQVRALDATFEIAEWGFALAVEYWGRGLFVDAARLVVDFTFNVIRAYRLEARATVLNGRGNGALKKIGAVQEGVLRRSFLRDGQYLDQALWTILADEWVRAKAIWGPKRM